MKTLLLGGVKSGKSRHAEELAVESGHAVTVIATALRGDAEMTARIQRHRQTRPAGWRVIEEPLDLSHALQLTIPSQDNTQRQCVIIDCLTLWITQLLCSELLKTEVDDVIKNFGVTVADYTNDLILVSNETNMGVMPMDALSRQYCDQIGRLHQTLATQVDRVTLMVAGLPLSVK